MNLFISGLVVSCLLAFLFTVNVDARLTFPMVYQWAKRTKIGKEAEMNHFMRFHRFIWRAWLEIMFFWLTLIAEGCTDPTEPFQCPGTNICISLQFLCDGHPGDCPDDYDEDRGLCVACKLSWMKCFTWASERSANQMYYLVYFIIAKRPPKDTIRRFLTAQYTNYGSKFIEYMFGSKALTMFSKWPTVKAIDVISISLAGKVSMLHPLWASLI